MMPVGSSLRSHSINVCYSYDITFKIRIKDLPQVIEPSSVSYLGRLVFNCSINRKRLTGRFLHVRQHGAEMKCNFPQECKIQGGRETKICEVLKEWIMVRAVLRVHATQARRGRWQQKGLDRADRASRPDGSHQQTRGRQRWGRGDPEGLGTEPETSFSQYQGSPEMTCPEVFL